MPTFESFDGLPLFYDDEKGSGRPVVLLHGFAADTNINWVRSGILDALIDEGHRVVALDARGHGLSGKPHDPQAYTGDAMTRDVQALLDHLGCDACSVVGYSMGGATALHLASVDPRVQVVVLLGVGDVTVADRARRPLADALLTEDPSTIADDIAREFRRLADSVRADRQALAALASASRADLSQCIEEVGVPILVAAGDDDVLAGSPHVLADRIPGAKALTVPGGHFSALAHPRLHRALVDFLKGRENRS